MFDWMNECMYVVSGSKYLFQDVVLDIVAESFKSAEVGFSGRKFHAKFCTQV
jgi:hypothetical protein